MVSVLSGKKGLSHKSFFLNESRVGLTSRALGTAACAEEVLLYFKAVVSVTSCFHVHGCQGLENCNERERQSCQSRQTKEEEVASFES